jgi:hypothetical protein
VTCASARPLEMSTIVDRDMRVRAPARDVDNSRS